MVDHTRIAVIVLVLLLAGCAPRQQDVTIPRKAVDFPELTPFQDAEKAFDNGHFEAALDGYNAYLRSPGDGRYEDVALFRIGRIYQISGRDDDAAAVFGRLIREYPYSPLVSDAQIAILKRWFDAQRYEAVVHDGIRSLETVGGKTVEFQLLMLIADSYTALDSVSDAAEFYYRAWNAATEDEDAARAWENLKKSVERLNSAEIQRLIATVSDKRAMGFLLYRLGLAFIMAEQYDDAVDVLHAFVAQFPGHKDHQDAVEMIASLTERSRFVPFSIGCLLPLSGTYAIFGKRALDGVELAMSHALQTGDDIPFQLVVRDTGSDAETALVALEGLDAARVGAVVGPIATAEPAAKAAQARGIPMLVFTQREDIAGVGSYVFRNFITPEMQARAVAQYATGTLNIRRFAILYPKEQYGSRYMNLFWDQVISHGGIVTAVAAYDPSGTDFAEPIKKLAALYYDAPEGFSRSGVFRRRGNTFALPGKHHAGLGDAGDALAQLSGLPLPREAIDQYDRSDRQPEDRWSPIVDFDAIFIPDAPKKAGLVIPQLAYYDIRDVFLLGTNLWNSKTLLEMSGDYMQNTIIVDGFFVDSQEEPARQFVAEFERTYQRRPGIIEAMAYDNTLMALQTMRQTATDSRRDLKDALLQLHDFPGVTGRTGFTASGEAEKDLVLLRIKHGQFVQVKASEDSAGTAANSAVSNAETD